MDPIRRAVIILGVVYLIIGIGFGELVNTTASEQIRFWWRLGSAEGAHACKKNHISFYETQSLHCWSYWLGRQAALPRRG
jgi:hypothetical protein